MDDKVLLGLSIPTASEKLKGLFPIDARGDVIISFKTKIQTPKGLFATIITLFCLGIQF